MYHLFCFSKLIDVFLSEMFTKQYKRVDFQKQTKYNIIDKDVGKVGSVKKVSLKKIDTNL